MSNPGDMSSMSFQLDSSGAWIELAEPPGSNADLQVATIDHDERQICADLEPSFPLALSSNHMPLHDVARERAATRRVEAELSAALAARSFVNGIVIGNILNQSQQQHPENQGDVTRTNSKRSNSSGGETIGSKLKREWSSSPSKAKGLQHLTVGKAGAYAPGDRPRSRSVHESGSGHSSFHDKDKKVSPKSYSQRDHKSSIASQEGGHAKSEAKKRKNSKNTEENASSTHVSSEGIHGEDTQPNSTLETEDVGNDEEIEDAPPIAETSEEIAVNAQPVPQFAELAQNNMYYGGWPSLAADSLCGLEVLGGQHLGGLQLEAELPYALAGLFGFNNFHQSDNGAVAQTLHGNDGVSFAGFGQDVHPDYAQHFMYGSDSSGYPNPLDYGCVRPGEDDQVQHMRAGSANISRQVQAASEEAFEPEDTSPTSASADHSVVPVQSTSPVSPLESNPELPMKARESVKMPKLQLPVPSAKSKQKPNTAQPKEIQRATTSAKQSAEVNTNEEKHESVSPPSRQRRMPPIQTQPQETNEDVYIYRLTARPAVPLASPPRPGEMSNVAETDLDHSISNSVENMEGSVEAGNSPGGQDRMAVARSHSNKLLSTLSRQSESASNSPQKRSLLIGSARSIGSPRSSRGVTQKAPAPLNPRLRALITSDQNPTMNDSKGTLATVRTMSTRVGGSSQSSSNAVALPKVGKAGGLSPLEAAKQAHWRRHRELQWNTSFATIAGRGIPDVVDSGQVCSERATTAPVARQKPSEAAQLSWTESQAKAAHWAISLAVNPVRPVSVPSHMAHSLSSPAKNPMTDMLSKIPKRDISQDYTEWYGSPLHRAFLNSLEQQKEDEQDADAGEAGMALFAIEDQLERTHTELRDLLEEHVSGTSELSESAWTLRAEFLLEVLLEEMQIPNQHREPSGQGNMAETDALAEHASQILAYRDTTVRIIGGLVDRDRVQATAESAQYGEDAEAQHLEQISHALNLGIATWCRHFGHFAQLTCGQVAGETRSSLSSLSPSKDTSGQQPVFLWCGQDASHTLMQMPQGQGTPDSRASNAKPWPVADMRALGQVPYPQPPSMDGSSRALPGFRTQERASRSATRGLRSLLRGGIGAAGQYVISKQAPPHVNELFEHT